MGSHLPADPLSVAAPGRRDLAGDAAPARDARAAAGPGLYVHVPFCARRCTYCDFATGALSRHAVDRWLAALEREAEQRAPAAGGTRFRSVFFGGGTPSALSAAEFARAWRVIRDRFALAPGAEITVEANPESVTERRLAAWAEAGVNRLSMGAQSFDARELERLGRIHDADRPARAFALARAAGFRRLSLDLMFGFPGHDATTWSATLERALALDPEHLSFYCYIPEAGTVMGDAVAAGDAILPDPGTQADLYAQAVARLATAGLDVYETSNAARPGAESRHNLGYWLVRPYLALGPAAHGFWAGERFANHASLSRWATALERGRSCEAEREAPDAEARALETMMLGLRLASGLRPEDHDRAAWSALRARFAAALDEAAERGRLERAGGGWQVPARHRFLADDTIAWVAARAERVPVAA
jgi:oxygen-independent coproporphyrinogen III oxidase